MPQPPSQQEHVRDPIRWSSDNPTVYRVMKYCEEQYHKVPETTRYGKARREILARIHGNLCNSGHRAYNGRKPFGQVDFESVARQLTRHCDDTAAGQAEKDGFVVALSSEWNTLHAYFQRQFFKPDPD